MEIFVDENDKLDAAVAANTFTQNETRHRAYINTLGAELAIKYLASENINTSNIFGIHSIKKILEEIDISDIILSNIHIDVRVVFDENAIFIPKSHFEYNVVPDIYLVMKLAQDMTSVECLGFFEPKLINKNNQNNDYYFIEKEKLNSALDLKKFIDGFKGNKDQSLSESEIERCETIIVSMADNDITDSDKKYLIQNLVKSSELRSKFIEYENFETLSYKAMTDSSIVKKEIVENDIAVEPVIENVIDDIITEEPVEENMIEESVVEDVIGDIAEDLSLMPLDDELTDAVGDFSDGNEDTAVEDSITAFETLEDITDGVEEVVAAGELVTDLVEPLAFDNIELPELTEHEDPVSEVTSFDDIDNVELEDVSQEEVLDETLPLDNIELPEIADEDNSQEDVMSFSDIEDINISDEPIEEDLPAIDEVQDESLEELQSLKDVEPMDEILDEVQQLEEVESLDEISQINEIEPLDEISQLDEVEQLGEPLTDLEDLHNEEPLNDENVEEIGNIDELSNIEDSTDNLPVENSELEEDILPEIDDIINTIDNVDNSIIEEEPVENTENSFGNNLLENLQEEENTKDVSSDDLLSEIDNILGDDAETLTATVGEVTDIPELADIIEDTAKDSNEFSMDDLMETDSSGDDLEVLYKEDAPQQELPAEQEEVQAVEQAPKNNKKTVVVAAALAVALAGAGVFTLMKSKQENVEDFTPTTVNENPANDNLLTVNTPEVVKTEAVKEVKEPVKELKNTVPQGTSQAYMSVNRIVWDVPDSVAYSVPMQNYFKTAGKSIKLSLSADLLLATEFAYTNQVKVGLKMSNSGAIQESKILSSSGSTQIDNIVLQSVKDTLNALKPPSDEAKNPNFNLSLIIYF